MRAHVKTAVSCQWRAAVSLSGRECNPLSTYARSSCGCLPARRSHSSQRRAAPPHRDPTPQERSRGGVRVWRLYNFSYLPLLSVCLPSLDPLCSRMGCRRQLAQQRRGHSLYDNLKRTRSGVRSPPGGSCHAQATNSVKKYIVNSAKCAELWVLRTEKVARTSGKKYAGIPENNLQIFRSSLGTECLDKFVGQSFVLYT